MPTTFFGWVGFILEKYGPLLLQGAETTLMLAIIGTTIGFLIGLGIAIVRTLPLNPGDSIIKKAALKLVRGLMIAYIEIFRGTPMIVQASVIYYAGLQYLHLDMPALFAGMFVVSINTGAYMAEIVRGGVISVDPGQTEGAQSLGMTHWQTMITVILPQAIRNIMPSIGNEFVVNIKDSSVLSVISVTELFFVSTSAAGTYARYFEASFVACLIYFVLTFTVTRILMYLERRMDGPDTYAIHGSQTTPESMLKVKHIK